MRIVQLIFVLCLVPLFLSASTDALVLDGEQASTINQQIISEVFDHDDKPDLVLRADTGSNLVIGVLIVALFNLLPKPNLNLKKTLFIRGPPIFLLKPRISLTS